MAEEEVQLDELHDLIDQLEEIKRDEELDPEMLEWMTEISDPEYDLVASFVNVFLDNLSNKKLANSILRSLRYRLLNSHVKKNTLPQMKANSKFPVAIAKYIAETTVKDLEGDGFVLLAEIFDTTQFKEVSDEKFVVSMFNSLGFIKDEDIFYAIVKIIVSISVGAVEMVAAVCKKHENFRFFAEALLQIYNKSHGELSSLILDFLSSLMDVFTEDFVFYTNDLKVLVDILIRNLSNPEHKADGVRIMRVLKKTLESGEYKKIKYRASDLAELYEDLQLSSDHSSDVMAIWEDISNSGLI